MGVQVALLQMLLHDVVVGVGVPSRDDEPASGGDEPLVPLEPELLGRLGLPGHLGLDLGYALLELRQLGAALVQGGLGVLGLLAHGLPLLVEVGRVGIDVLRVVQRDGLSGERPRDGALGRIDRGDERDPRCPLLQLVPCELRGLLREDGQQLADLGVVGVERLGLPAVHLALLPILLERLLLLGDPLVELLHPRVHERLFLVLLDLDQERVD